MSRLRDPGLSRAGFAEFRRRFRAAPGAVLALTTADGRLVLGELPARLRPVAVAGAIAEALRWGEPCVAGDAGCFLWAVPTMRNARVLGAVVAWIREEDLLPHGPGRACFDVRAACSALREVAEQLDCTNAAQLRLRRDEMAHESLRAGFLHSLKRGGVDGLVANYLREEAALVAAIRAGDRNGGRTIINRLLIGIWQRAAGSLEAVKSLLLELVVLMCRTAVDSGSPRDALLGTGLLDLAAVHDDVALARWVKRAFERIFDALETRRSDPDEEAFQRATRWINEHCHEDLSRDLVADAVGVSPARLSWLLRAEGGRGFNELVNRARIDRARALIEGGASALDAALSVGFKDPSYFTKVFRRLTGATPRAWRGGRGLRSERPGRRLPAAAESTRTAAGARA